jgi:tetraacyldisaccharide 4'-kinase
MARPAPRAPLPTLLVGGFTVGGDGKTPAALALASMLAAMGERPAFVTRGYGRRRVRDEPFLVDPARRGACEAGDEALLLARRAPTIVSIDRLAGIRLARQQGASIVILDDGLQSRRVEPDFVVAVVDAQYGVGNGRCLPAGPLRAPLERQIEAADAVLIVGVGAAGESIAQLARAAGKLVFHARLRPESQAAARFSGQRVLAFAGIGRPEKFLLTLEAVGADVAGRRWFPDHWRYSERDLAALEDEALRLGAILVTTEKDAVRLPKRPAVAPIGVLPVSLALQEPEAVETALLKALERFALSRGA